MLLIKLQANGPSPLERITLDVREPLGSQQQSQPWRAATLASRTEMSLTELGWVVGRAVQGLDTGVRSGA